MEKGGKGDPWWARDGKKEEKTKNIYTKKMITEQLKEELTKKYTEGDEISIKVQVDNKKTKDDNRSRTKTNKKKGREGEKEEGGGRLLNNKNITENAT